MPKYEVRRCEKPSEKWGVFTYGASTPISEFDTEDAARDHLEKLELLIRELSKKFKKEPDAQTEGLTYCGVVLEITEGAWAQKINREGDWVVHLSSNSPQRGSVVETKFKNGKTEIKAQNRVVER